MSSISRWVRSSGFWAPDRRAAARPGSVTSIASSASRAPELARVELGAPRLEQLLELPARHVARLAHRPALLRGQIGDPAQDLGQLGLPPQVADPELLELGGRRGRADRLGRFLPDLLDPLNHRRRPSDAIRCSAIAAAAATLRDSALSRTGIVTRTSHRPRPRSGRPSRSAPRQSVAAPSSAVERLAAVRDQRGPRAGGRARSPPRTSGSAKTAPMLARTACAP